MSIRQKTRFDSMDTVLTVKSIGLLQIDTTSPLKKLRIFTYLDGMPKNSLDSGKTILKSIILSQNHNTGYWDRYLQG